MRKILEVLLHLNSKAWIYAKNSFFYAHARAERYGRVKLRTFLLLTIEFLCSS
jgi:hypothetical protein